MKEAKGQKAYDSFEIVARTMLFRPTFSVLSPEDAAAVSSVHALVGPVLMRLEGCENARYDFWSLRTYLSYVRFFVFFCIPVLLLLLFLLLFLLFFLFLLLYIFSCIYFVVVPCQKVSIVQPTAITTTRHIICIVRPAKSKLNDQKIESLTTSKKILTTSIGCARFTPEYSCPASSTIYLVLVSNSSVCVCVWWFPLCREVGKANEALTRIGMGLAANPSVTEPEMLLYVHATVAPFLLPQVLFFLQEQYYY